MSQILIFIDDATLAPDVLMSLQRTTGRGLSAIRDAVGHGKPIFEREIFDADYEAHAATIRAIVSCLTNTSIPSRIYELPEGETMETCAFVDKCLISTDVLENILSQADAELDRQLGE